VTHVLEEAGQTMGIPLLDHLIISHSGFVSLRSIFRKD
jgi:DNA repair protein RadC